jgi:hypothetical protein
MPVLQYYNLEGTLVAQQSASSVSADGTSLQASVGSLSGVLPGVYLGIVSNENSGGILSVAGSAVVTVTGPLPSGTGIVDIMGSSRSTGVCDGGGVCNFIYDSGTVSVTVNGLTKSASYSGSGYPPSQIASDLASGFNSDSTSSVTAHAIGEVVFLSQKSGAPSGMPFSASSASSDTVDFPGPPSFIPTLSALENSGASVNVLGSWRSTVVCNGGEACNLIYDSGTVSVTANGLTKSATYSGNGYPDLVALANAFNSDSTSPVTASASGNTLALTSNSGGFSIWAESLSSDPFDFQGPAAFLASPSVSLNGSGTVTVLGSSRSTVVCGGGGACNIIYDSGTVFVTVNGLTKSASYSGSGYPPSWIVSALATAFNSDSSSTATASANGSVLTLTSKSGSGGRLIISISSFSDDTNDFPGLPSFIGVPSSSLAP